MLQFAKNLVRRQTSDPGFVFSRPLLAIQSDDWGRVGVRDRDACDSLRAQGVNLGEHPYDFYSLETSEDVEMLGSMLLRHRDSIGRPPCVAMNFCTANLNFPKMRAQGYEHIKLLPLASGLPGSWSRPGLFEAYKSGIANGVFFPAMHSLTHFCPVAVENALARGGERADLLRKFWRAETPYVYWRMPWVGYEYWNPERPHRGFLSAELQELQIRKAAACFSAMFGTPPISACAPGYFANHHTRRAWSEAGIRVAQNGTSGGMNAPHIDAVDILHLHRTIDLEPSHRELDVEKYVQICDAYFSRGLPVIISSHSINFHSTLKDFRSATLAALDRLLSAIESKYPDLLYVHDQDLHAIVTEGVFRSRDERVAVLAKREWNRQVVHQGAV
ncbi:MAG TPA: hypothetical protein VFA85_10575 [Terriglobales bacterium]|nr:hypothetical protein [Terriglobales bacterium]